MPSFVRTGSLFVRLAGLSGATAVALGAYGAHSERRTSFKDPFLDHFSFFSLFAAFTADKADLKKVYDTANFYHFIHTVALLAVPLSRKPVLVSEEYINRICMADMELPRSKVRELMERPVYPTPQEPVSRYGYENWSFKLALEIWNGIALKFVSDRGADGERDDCVLRDDLLSRAHRGEVSAEVHALRRNAPHRGLAQHGHLIEPRVWRSNAVAYLSSDGLKKVTCHGTECITI